MDWEYFDEAGLNLTFKLLKSELYLSRIIYTCFRQLHDDSQRKNKEIFTNLLSDRLENTLDCFGVEHWHVRRVLIAVKSH